MDKNKHLLNYLINLSFFLYFIILFTERTISLVLTFKNEVDVFGEAFNVYIYSLIFLSLGGFLIYLLLRCYKGIIGLFVYQEDYPFIDLCIASGILLLSGMVHSEYTIPAIQFVSYGILIIGILLKVILNHSESNHKPLLWLSFSYLVAYSMAIPVMYYSLIQLHILFHILEAATSFLMVGVFTFLLVHIFNEKDDLFMTWTIAFGVILDTTLIVLRWNEEINWFVLIFISLSFVLFLVGYIYKKRTK